MTIRNTDWMDRALCAQVDPELWFPARGENNATAARLCHTCPVRTDCGDYALAELNTNTDHGAWGGAGPVKRRADRKGET